MKSKVCIEQKKLTFIAIGVVTILNAFVFLNYPTIHSLQMVPTNVGRSRVNGTQPIFSLMDMPTEKNEYLDLAKRAITGHIYPEAGSYKPGTVPKLQPFVARERENGLDWPVVGHTMVGIKRLSNIEQLIHNIKLDNIAGDFLEAGVWRGGASIFARLAFDAYEMKDRKVWVCDSFSGLPPSIHKEDSHRRWDDMHYLEVSLEEVKRNFGSYGIDVDDESRVGFIKGYFTDSFPLIYNESIRISNIALLRMDGDMFESSFDILFNSFHLVPIGGWVIVDDWFGFPAKIAVETFHEWHSINPPSVVPIDAYAVYYRKTIEWENITIDYARYLEWKGTI